MYEPVWDLMDLYIFFFKSRGGEATMTFIVLGVKSMAVISEHTGES